jgi:hypothetical protein
VELPPVLTALGPALRLTDGATAAAVTATVVDWVAVPPDPVHLSVYVAVAWRLPVVCEPASAFAPAHEPLAMHDVACDDDQLSVAAAPFVIVLGLAPKLTVGTAGVTEINADWVALPLGPVQLSV